MARREFSGQYVVGSLTFAALQAVHAALSLTVVDLDRVWLLVDIGSKYCASNKNPLGGGTRAAGGKGARGYRLSPSFDWENERRLRMLVSLL